MASLSLRESKLRSYILTEELWKVILYITYPLAIYALFNHLYGFIDMVMVAHIGNTEVASVAIFSEIQSMITAFGAGIASGGAVIVARLIGASKIDEAKKNASTVFFLAVFISIGVIVLLVPLARPLLVLLRTPKDVIDTGLGYFIVQIFTTAFITINSVFIGLEKAKGNTQKILYLNIVMMIIKIGLTALFVYGLGKGIIWVSFATMIAQGVLTLIAFAILFNKKNTFQIKLSEIRLKKEVVLPILKLSFPIFIGKFIFSFGKVIVNSIAATFGTQVVSGFSVAMKIGSGGAALANSFEESIPTIVSQNAGNNQVNRAMKAYPIALMFSGIVAVITIAYSFLFRDFIIGMLVNSESSKEYIQIVIDLFRWEIFSKLTSAIVAITLGMFYGFRLTKVTLLMNIARLFVFRIPALWLLSRYTDLGHHSIGVAMFVSNTSTAILAVIMAVVFFKKVKNNGYGNFLVS